MHQKPKDCDITVRLSEEEMLIPPEDFRDRNTPVVPIPHPGFPECQTLADLDIEALKKNCQGNS